MSELLDFDETDIDYEQFVDESPDLTIKSRQCFRATHRPTGITVIGNSQKTGYHNKIAATVQLKRRLRELANEIGIENRKLTQEQQELVVANMGIAGIVVKNSRIHVKSKGEIDELVGRASLALCKAAQDYKSNTGVKFSTYAYNLCRFAVRDYIFDEGLIFTPNGDRTSDDRAGYRSAHAKAARSIKWIGPSNGAKLLNCQSIGPREQLEANEEAAIGRETIESIMRTLSCTQRTVFRSRLDGETFAAIGKELGVSKERVRQVMQAVERKIVARYPQTEKFFISSKRGAA